MDDFAEIARRMRELNLERDRPFTHPLEQSWEAELNAKLQPKKPEPEPEPGNDQWDYGF